MQTIEAPERTHDQRMAALKGANAIRTERSQLKLRVKASGKQDGSKLAVSILETVPPMTETMKVLDLVMSIPSLGWVKANRVLADCRISPNKTIGGLTNRQRGELVSRLP